MTGLFLKELLVRGDLRRCMIVTPGSLAEQWQDELYRKFSLRFEILTNDRIESAVTGNAFAEVNLCIVRLDKLSRNEEIQGKLKATDWDLIVCDEAHKMSATVWGGEIKYTKRFQLGRLLSDITRHFLLLTATPHNGKEEDFQLFMSLVDQDRFEGVARSGGRAVDVLDVMQRLVKEELLKFDGTPLFPERIANTVNYDLSPPEANLYTAVTEYVQEEFNRADKLNNERKTTVGFALTTLQRRRERLENRLAEERLGKRVYDSISNSKLPPCNFELVGYFDPRLALPPETLRVSSATPQAALGALSMSRIPIPDRTTTHSIWNWNQANVEEIAVGYAISNVIPAHVAEVRERKTKLIAKTMKAVKDRLSTEIQYWDYRAVELQKKEQVGLANAKLNSQMAARRAEELEVRLQRRLAELETEKIISAMPPIVVGGALVIPRGLPNKLTGRSDPSAADAAARREIELAAMKAVMDIETSLGFIPIDVSGSKVGYDIESRVPEDRREANGSTLWFIEVKGRAVGADSVTVTRNEIIAGLNKPDDYILAAVEVDGAQTKTTYLKKPFREQPDFAANSINYDIAEMIGGAEVLLKRGY